jgi:glycosyltransferase involved in cell wall biosynthesis
MRIGLIARADNTGLGIQSKEFFDHIQCQALVIDFSAMSPAGLELLKPDLSRFPNQRVFKWGTKHNLRGDIPREVIADFIKDIDILFCMETPYDYNIFEMCRERGVKTVLQLNYEFLDFPHPTLPPPDLFAAPSPWNYLDIPCPKVLLPVPVNTKHFEHVEPILKTFVHIIGRAAAYDRNGTDTLFQALNYVKNKITMTVHSQLPVRYTLNNSNVKLIIQESNQKNYQSNYQGGVLVLPRKYGGLSLVMNEAIGAGMPVIATDISPNNTWLPKEWLVRSNGKLMFKSKRLIEVHEANVQVLAEKIDQFCDLDFFNEAVLTAKQIREKISWNTLLPLYLKTFNEL